MPPADPTGRLASRRATFAAAGAACALGIAGCALDSPSLVVPARTGATGATVGVTPAPASGLPSTYTGLGSHAGAFARGHHMAALSGAARAGQGEVASDVSTSGAGRVTGYVMTFNYQPRLSDFQRLASAVGNADLPADRITVKSAATCIVYASPTLKRLIGLLYTSVATTPGSTTAHVQTRPTSGC